MNSLYDYFNKMIDKNKISHSFLIGNVQFDDIKNDLYKIFNQFIFNLNDDNYFNPDIYIIRPEKGNISKDSIKDLIKEISTTSQFNNNKVYVIDGCEKLNDYSYNAILKTLEEPKNNIYAFLITSNIDSIKPTIASRCQKIYLSTNVKDEEFDETIVNIGNELMNYIEKEGIDTIGKHPEIYVNIDSRETFISVLNYLLKIYFEKLNDCIYNKDDEEEVELISKKVLVINESIVELNNYLNKNLSIDRFIIKMWRCSYENS